MGEDKKERFGREAWIVRDGLAARSLVWATGYRAAILERVGWVRARTGHRTTAAIVDVEAAGSIGANVSSSGRSLADLVLLRLSRCLDVAYDYNLFRVRVEIVTQSVLTEIRINLK